MRRLPCFFGNQFIKCLGKQRGINPDCIAIRDRKAKWLPFNGCGLLGNNPIKGDKNKQSKGKTKLRKAAHAHTCIPSALKIVACGVEGPHIAFSFTFCLVRLMSFPCVRGCSWWFQHRPIWTYVNWGKWSIAEESPPYRKFFLHWCAMAAKGFGSIGHALPHTLLAMRLESPPSSPLPYLCLMLFCQV